MAKNKNFVDSAIESAEEIISEREEDTSAPQEAEPAPTEQIDQKADSEESKEQTTDTVEAAPAPETAPATPTVQPETPTIEPPKFWSAEHKALFAKAPVEVQQAILGYEQARTEWASRMAKDSAESRDYREKVTKRFEPIAEKLKDYGVSDPIEAGYQMLEWNFEFDSNPVKGVLELMKENQITLQDLHRAITTGDLGQQLPDDPRIIEAQTTAREAKELISQYTSAMKQQQEAFQKSEIKRFKSGKDSFGTVRKAFVEMYSPQISQAAERLMSENPAMPLYDALDKAYETVLSSARQAFGVQAQKPQANPQELAAKAKAAASSVSGAPINGAAASKKPKPKTTDEALDMAEEVLGLR